MLTICVKNTVLFLGLIFNILPDIRSNKRESDCLFFLSLVQMQFITWNTIKQPLTLNLIKCTRQLSIILYQVTGISKTNTRLSSQFTVIVHEYQIVKHILNCTMLQNMCVSSTDEKYMSSPKRSIETDMIYNGYSNMYSNIIYRSHFHKL